MSTQAILALDIGSSSIRASLYDHGAAPIPSALVKISNSFSATADGGSEMDADEAVECVFAAIDQLLELPATRDVEITHAATCAFWHSLIGVDSFSRPTTKVLGWADTRSRQYSAVLKKRFDEDLTHQRTGSHFHSSFWPAKLLWLRSDASTDFGRTATWLSFSDYVALRLFGTPVTSISMASATGIFEQGKCDWDAELISFVKIRRSQLPSISDAPATLTVSNALRWPQLKDTRWLPAIGDGAADHLGSCGIDKRRASLMVGTSAAMRVAYKGAPPEIPDGLWSYRVDRERVIIGGALSDGGNLYSKMKDKFKVPADAEDEMRRRGAAASGITVLPFFFGERSTGYNENATGQIIGRSDQHDPVDVLQAAMEGIGYRIAEICDRLQLVIAFREIVASGGALRASPVWAQIIADILGRDLTLSDTQESASKGAVLLALESLGKIESIERLPATTKQVLDYHPQCHKAYTIARRAHDAAYENARKTS